MSNYPESERLQAYDPDRRAVDRFLEWLDEEGFAVCERPGKGKAFETIYVPVPMRPETLIFRFLGIDPVRLEAERRAMLDGLRASPGDHTEDGTR